MAGEIFAILDPRSQGNRTVYARLYDTAGAQVGANIATTETGANTGIYIGDAPTLATGKYSLVFYRQRAGNDSLYASSDFYWNAATSAEVTESEYNYLTTTKARFDAVLAAITAEVSASTAAILTALSNGVALTTGQATALAVSIETALINEGDGQTTLAAIAQSVESAINNEGDSNATIAAFQGAVTAALNAYDPPTKAELDTSEAAIIAAMPVPSDATEANQTAMLSALGALTNGLTPAQATALTRVLDLLEADEDFSQATVLKYLKGTTTKLLEKTVSGGDPITQVTFVDVP